MNTNPDHTEPPQNLRGALGEAIAVISIALLLITLAALGATSLVGLPAWFASSPGEMVAFLR